MARRVQAPPRAVAYPLNAKLDSVIAGIQELKIGQIGQAVLNAYIDMHDPMYLIETYFQDLVSYKKEGQTWPDAERKDFVDKLLGTKSAWDSVAFCANQIVKLSPITQGPLFFELLFPYLLAGATAANARTVYLSGAYALRAVAEILNKGLILESFAIASSGGDPARVADGVRKATEKYKGWMRAMSENSFLPFAERLATFNLKDEYLGGHDTRLDAHRLRKGWKPVNLSILQNADGLAAKLMGKAKTVTIRIIPNVPPIEKVVPASKPRTDTAYGGTHEWEIIQGPTPSLPKEMYADWLASAHMHFFRISVPSGPYMFDGLPAEIVSRVEIPFTLKDEDVPPGFDKKNKRLSFFRCQFDCGGHPDGAYITLQYYDYGMQRRHFPPLKTRWRRWYVEEGRRLHPVGEEEITYGLLNSDGPVSTAFQLPPDGQLSLALVTYVYETFGPAQS